MEVLIVNQREVAQLLPMNECIDVMADVLAALSRGQGLQPLRPVMWLPERVGALGRGIGTWVELGGRRHGA
jgi:hypothetical protein